MSKSENTNTQTQKDRSKYLLFVLTIILVFLCQMVNYSINRSRDENFLGLQKVLYPNNVLMKFVVGVFQILMLAVVVIMAIVFAVVYFLDKEKRLLFLFLSLIMINAGIPAFSLGMIGIENIADVIILVGG